MMIERPRRRRFSLQARTRAGATTSRAGLGLLVLGLLHGCGSDTEPAPGTTEDTLLLTGTKFPGRTIPVCWDPSAVVRADFAASRDNIMTAVARSWTQATGLHFSGWQTCPTDASGQIRISLFDGGGGNTQVGYTGGETYLHIGAGQLNGSAMHELGHALGFHHEMARADFVDDPEHPCKQFEIDRPGDTVGTPSDLSDSQSIMATTYCQWNENLSAWDVAGVQNVYGRPNYFADVDGDGKADAVLVNPDGIKVRTSDGSRFLPYSYWTGAFFGEYGTYFADVNGDHMADALAVKNGGIKVRFSDGGSFEDEYNATNDRFYGNLGTFFADVTGDGRADAIAVNYEGIYVRPSDGNGFPAYSQTMWQTSPVNPGFGVFATSFVDVTGDGRADYVEVRDTGVWVGVSEGAYFDEQVNWTGASFGYASDNGTFFADMDGDGRADAVRVALAGIKVLLSDGTSFAVGEQDWTPGPFYGDRGTFLADVGGDAGAEMIAVNDDGVFVGMWDFGWGVGNWTHGSFYGGEPYQNLARGGVARQWSDLPGYGAVAALAIDGNTDGNFWDGSVTHSDIDTEFSSNQWWYVDLGAEKRARQVNIYNRTDCCSERLGHFQVKIWDATGSSWVTAVDRSQWVASDGAPQFMQIYATTRYVMIMKTDADYLSLAEVQVLGY